MGRGVFDAANRRRIAIKRSLPSLRRLTPARRMDQHDHVEQSLTANVDAQALEAMPEALVLTSPDLTILAANTLFLTLANQPDGQSVVGQPISRFLGPIALEEHDIHDRGNVREYITVLDAGSANIDVTVSAVATAKESGAWFGFCVRPLAPAADAGRHHPLVRSVEQLTELVGRVPLKEIVRESTDLIERLCIEAALNYTADNRASAADILGLSRQSLYSKLHRHGIGNLATNPE